MSKVSAPSLYYKVHCQKRVEQDDGYGNTVSDFATQFSVRAAFVHLRGGEMVIASRLENKHPMVVTLRSSAQTRQINADWQLVDARDGSKWAVRDVTPETDRQWISLLCERGVAA
jgi:SPP1 family predicted phage head-tail adaptor